MDFLSGVKRTAKLTTCEQGPTRQRIHSIYFIGHIVESFYIDLTWYFIHFSGESDRHSSGTNHTVQ